MSTDQPDSGAAAGQDLSALRAELFATLRDLRAGRCDAGTARAVNDIAGTLIDSARVEIAYRATLDDAGRSRFIDAEAGELPPGITGRTVHRIKG